MTEDVQERRTGGIWCRDRVNGGVDARCARGERIIGQPWEYLRKTFNIGFDRTCVLHWCCPNWDRREESKPWMSSVLSFVSFCWQWGLRRRHDRRALADELRGEGVKRNKRVKAATLSAWITDRDETRGDLWNNSRPCVRGSGDT